ncbi:hypothetical protein CesoFtcFv8_013583 [Champsocephalus esox]|uniref:Uncharacterized protein n=1 Tax=Champsocephalus esox TaxID=159716 RepID=A0AAN8BRP5_9TELE|nr:hypothetical protein CesoFtcFv8_013583 [Champsocephalus esox]
MEEQDVGVPFVFAMPAGRTPGGSTAAGLPGGYDYGGGGCRLATPPHHCHRGRLLRPVSSGAAGLRISPLARYMAVRGGDVATATENEGSSGNMGGNSKGARPLGHGVSRCAPP